MQELHAGYVASAVWAAIQNGSLPDDLDWMDVVRRLSHFVIDLDLETPSDPPPLVSMLANLLCRGLPTLPSLYIERRLERLTGLISCRPAGNSVVASYTGQFQCNCPQDLYKMLGRAFCPVSPGVVLNSSPGYGFPEFGDGDDDTRFDSEAEREFWEGPLKETLGPGGIQLALRQRPLDSIAGKDFKEQHVDVAVGLPGAIPGSTPRGIVFEVDGPSHQGTVGQDQRRDEGCRKAGWAETYRRRLWKNEPASAAVESTHGGVSSLLSHPYLRYANQNIAEPLVADDLGRGARSVALFPLAVARIQCVIIHLLLSGHLSLSAPVWNIAVLDRDSLGGVGEAACRDLRIWMRRLWKMFDPSMPIPIIRAVEFSGESEPHVGARSVDVFIDVSVEMRYGTTRPDPPLPVSVSSAKRIVVRTDYYPRKGRRELLFGKPLTLQIGGPLLEESLTFVLRNVFRKLEFRPKQIEIIKRALRNESVIALLPTGAGKSITYQIPALLQNGIVIVVDPIKSLMKDQDDNLKAIGISASTFINSMTTSRERRENTRLLHRGVFKFAFVSPERFIIREFRDALNKMGASSAENEITTLADYYVEIDSFRRALRKEVRLVTGRKGSGKTAIFIRLRDTIRANRANVVLDLKPEGYQLLKFKDAIVRLMSAGTVEHTVTAFWEYLLWLEICYKLIEKDQDLHKRDHRLFEPYQRLLAAYRTDAYSGEGDFAERLSVLLRDIQAEIITRFGSEQHVELTKPQITELVYRHDFAHLKSLIQEYLQFKGELWLLFDNIDKGWPSHGIGEEDLVIVRSLIEASRKIERELQRKSVDAHSVIFLRNDIYEILVDSTSDRGKETRSNVDWADPELLREMLRRRIIRMLPDDKDYEFSQVWANICEPMVDGEESSQFLIDRCLMRPRSLIELIGHCRGYAVNLGHDKIRKDDIYKGHVAFSNDLVTELGLEIRDVFPEAENVLYAFIGSPSSFNRQTLERLLIDTGIEEEHINNVIDLLFWFGFLGFIWTNDEHRYIYSFNYNMALMRGIHEKLLKSGIAYVINPAFSPALGIEGID